MDQTTPLKPISTADIAWTEWADAQRFTSRRRHLSRAAIGDSFRVGVAIEELEPGKRSAPAHYHILEEEHVFILEGALEVRIGAETYPMQAGDYVCFPAGQRAGHCLVNTSGAVCRYVIVGERNPNEVVVYPDSNKVMVRALGRGAIFDMAATRRYWHGEDTGQPSEAGVLTGWALEPPVKGRPPISSANVEWDEEGNGPVFGGRSRHLTFAAVGTPYRVGVLIEAPAPGMRIAPRHYHLTEEEHALILEGEVTLLLGEERYPMKAGDYVCFPAGHPVGHSIMNSGTGPCSYLMIGEKNPHDVVVLTDSNKMRVRALGNRRAFFDLSAERAYLEGEATG